MKVQAGEAIDGTQIARTRRVSTVDTLEGAIEQAPDFQKDFARDQQRLKHIERKMASQAAKDKVKKRRFLSNTLKLFKRKKKDKGDKDEQTLPPGASPGFILRFSLNCCVWT